MKNSCVIYAPVETLSGYGARSRDFIKSLIRLKSEEWDIKIMDSIVTSVIKQFEERSIKGKEKYGTDLDREDLALIDWIEHAKQEHMDAILYLEKIKQQYLKEFEL